MNIVIQSVKTAVGSGWQVCIGKHCVTFRSESEAREFVGTLQARLSAPHVWPSVQQRAAG